MLRPRLRPTLSRKVKYWGVAPSAQKKLGREARRGSHDLRKLVGHANFLNTLTEQLDTDDCEVETVPSAAFEVSKQEGEKLEDLASDSDGESDGDSDSDSEEWSDESDDEEHTLSLTSSRSADSGNHEGPSETRISQPEGPKDYFQAVGHASAVLQLEDVRREVSAALRDTEKDGSISIAVTSLTETVDNLDLES